MTSSSSSDDDDHDKTRKKVPKKLVAKKVSTVVSSSDDDDDDENEGGGTAKNRGGNFPKYVKTKNEITLDEMGPAERIEINLDEKIKLIKVGRVISKVRFN